MAPPSLESSKEFYWSILLLFSGAYRLHLRLLPSFATLAKEIFPPA